MTEGPGVSEIADRWEVERELRRVVDRLGALPLDRAAAASADVRVCALRLVTVGRRLGVPIPADAQVPDLGPSGLAPLIAVLGRDCLDAAPQGDAHGLQDMHSALVTLRRSLP